RGRASRSAKLWVWLPLTTTSQSSGWSSGGWGPARRARPRPAPHLASAPLGPPAPPRSALAVAAELAVWGLLLEDPGRAQRVDLTDHGVGLVRGAGAAVQRQQVHRHRAPVAVSEHLEHVYAKPRHPAGRARQARQPRDLPDRRVPADGGHGAQVRVLEGDLALAAHVGVDHPGDRLAHLLRRPGQLAGGNVPTGEVSGGGHPGKALALQARSDLDAAALVLRQSPGRDDVRHAHAGGPDGDVGFQERAVIEGDVVVAHRLHAAAHLQLDPPLLELMGGVLAELGTELLDQVGAAL